MFNTAYIGLFDRSLLHMSLNQLELALKNATFESRTPVSMYQFDPFFNSIQLFQLRLSDKSLKLKDKTER